MPLEYYPNAVTDTTRCLEVRFFGSQGEIRHWKGNIIDYLAKLKENCDEDFIGKSRSKSLESRNLSNAAYEPK